MNKLFRSAGMLLLIAVLVFSLAACGQRTVQQPVESTPTVEPTKEIVVETPPPSPTPTPTPTPSVSVPPVAVTTVPMPMPSVSPTVAVTNEPVPTDANGNPITTASPTVSPSPSASPSPTPTPYSYDAAFASTIMPDSVTIPENAEEGVINANGVILRGGPSASAVILDTFDIGTRVAILGMENGWVEVVVNGESGYIKSDYVTRGTYINNAGITAPDYDSGAVYINNGSGNGMVIVPDGPVASNHSHSTTETIPNSMNDTPDIYGGVPIG